MFIKLNKEEQEKIEDIRNKLIEAEKEEKYEKVIKGEMLKLAYNGPTFNSKHFALDEIGLFKDPHIGNFTDIKALNALRAEEPKDFDPSTAFIQTKENKDTDKGLRFNQDKPRYDLLEPYAIEQLVKIFTKGAIKYADNNWLKGMKWSKMIASAKRHMAAFERGEDYDYDPKCESCIAGNCTNHTGELHIAQAAWNIMGLTSYYKHYPQGDDRLNKVLPKPKVGLDIDEVLCDWVGPWCKKFGYDIPFNWNFSYDNNKHFFEDMSIEELSEFYLNLPTKIDPKDLKFEPHCYITSRTVPIEITKKWLQKNGFPTVPVYSVPFGTSKVDIAKESGVDWFIDDSYNNFVELNQAGIACYLLTAEHNRKYNVGYRRIDNLKDFKI